MPEFPEVNIQIGYLREHCSDWKTERFGLTGRCEQFTNIPAAERTQTVLDFFTDSQITSIYQRGKLIVFVTNNGVLISHLMYCGRWSIEGEPFVSNYKHHTKPPTDKTMSFWLEDQRNRRLCFYDPQNQAKLRIYPGLTDLKLIKELATLGPEVIHTPFSTPGFTTWTLTAFRSAARVSHQFIGDFLLDQHKIAGLGRTYVREALRTVRVEPKRHIDSLSNEELEMIANTIISMLYTSISTKLDYQSVFGIVDNSDAR